MKPRSNYLSVSQRDFIKGLVMGLISTAISVAGDAILQVLITDGYSLTNIHWPEIGGAVLVSMISYIKVKVFSNSNGDMFKKEPLAIKGQELN
ncbi:MAG: hypothetical protein WAQ28_03530 [Bacteroidia bacterium]